MKSDLKAKFLQHLVGKRQESGFTLIELLVVIVIIGILSAIALPSFLNQANKARQSEAKTYVGAINRSQQAYFVEYGEFGTQVELEGGVAAKTQNFEYAVTPAATTAIVKASALKQALKSYAGMVAVDGNTTPAIACETAGTTLVPPTPTFAPGAPGATGTFACGAGAAPIGQ